MARTGLRMMPTFPSPPLKFRTAGFPQYGFKASMSDRAFLQAHNLKPAPGIRSLPRSLLLPFARFLLRRSPGTLVALTFYSTATATIRDGLSYETEPPHLVPPN